MKVRRKSLWRSKNAKQSRKFANMRAAKERLRLARLTAPSQLPDSSATYHPAPLKPLFVVTIRCRDGERVRLLVREGAHGLIPSPTAVARKVAALLTHYRPA